MRSLFNIVAVALVVLVVSCEKNEQIPANGTSGSINIILKSAQMENAIGTKSLDKLPDEGTGTDYRVKDYWLIQYASDGKIIGDAKYIETVEGEDYKTPVIIPEGDDIYYCLFIANTHNPELNADFEEYKSTLASMTGFYKNISSLDDTYNVAGEDLIMSGIAKLASTDTQLYCKLYRNIAKITVKITNKEESGITIKSINIRNVPGGALYADRLLNETSLPGITAASAPFPDSYSLPYIDYELDNISIAAGSKDSLVWYIPRNMKGTASDVTSADVKNKYAPELATYIEIYATTGNGEPLKYRFYLGNDATNNFDVEPNKHYTVPITFIDKGSVIDSRVNDYSVIALKGNSNCYIINPLPIEEQALYSLPITRVNEFWSSQYGTGNGADNTISSETEWIAEVIWQDQPQRLINFIDDNGNTADSYTATGLSTSNSFQFEVLKGVVGNVVVGVRKASEQTYLWSWHLWITDYTPDNCAGFTWKENKYIYYVTGGQVHRYAGEFWNNNYQNRYIMDRNLGALSADRKAGIEKTGGFIYQYGRKDPIPQYYSKIYDIAGNLKSFSGETDNPVSVVRGPVNIYKSVNEPYNFYSVSSGDWASDNAHGNLGYSWNGASDEKSIFDPCPEGWMIPKNEVWQNFVSGTEVNKNSSSIMRNTIEAGVEFYIDGKFEDSHESYNIAYYPAAGIRKVTDGKSENYKLRGYVHSTYPTPNSSYCWSLDYVLKSGENVTVATSSLSSRAKGLNVRCIREKASNGNTSQESGNNNQVNKSYEQQPL